MLHCLAVSPDGARAAFGGTGPEIALCDLITGRELRRLTVPAPTVRSLRFSPDSARLLSGSGEVQLMGRGRDCGALCLWDVESGRRLWGWTDSREPVLSVAFTEDGRSAVSSTGWPARDRLNATRIWEVDSGQQLSRHDGHRQPVYSAVFLPGGQRLLLGSRDRFLRVWDPESRNETHRFEGHLDSIFSVAVSPDGRFALTGSGDRTVRYWRLPEQGMKG